MDRCEWDNCNMLGHYTDPLLDGKMYCLQHLRRQMDFNQEEKIRKLESEIGESLTLHIKAAESHHEETQRLQAEVEELTDRHEKTVLIHREQIKRLQVAVEGWKEQLDTQYGFISGMCKRLGAERKTGAWAAVVNMIHDLVGVRLGEITPDKTKKALAMRRDNEKLERKLTATTLDLARVMKLSRAVVNSVPEMVLTSVRLQGKSKFAASLKELKDLLLKA